MKALNLKCDCMFEHIYVCVYLYCVFVCVCTVRIMCAVMCESTFYLP